MPGLRVFMNMPQQINLGGQQGARSPYQFTLQDTDTTELYEWAPMLEDKIRAIAGLEDVSSDLQVKNPQIRVDMNRDRISALGLTVTRWRPRSTTPTAPGRSRRSTRRTINIRS